MKPVVFPEAGAVFAGSYRILRPLGRGGMGDVYVVEHISTGAARALKILQPELCANERIVRLFQQEARVGHRIRSDHVVDVIDAGIEVAIPWLVMELLEGENLAEHVRRTGVLPRGRATNVLAQIGHALAAAHTEGVVHRDLKPENVFVTTSRREGDPLLVKVLDFGVAKVLDEARMTGTLVGTPLWMAPEQITGAPVTPATDVWSLGLLTFWTLTGRIYWPVQDGSLLRHLLKISDAPALPAASARAAELGCAALIPPGFDAWFARCTAPVQTARFAEAGAAMNALQFLLRDPPAAIMGHATIEVGATATEHTKSHADLANATATAEPDVPAVPPSDAPTATWPQPCAMPRAELVREILQLLYQPHSVGVALMTPLGFDAHRIVGNVLERLQRSGEPLLPVRLVPDRAGAHVDGLYERLLRDLRFGLPAPWRKLTEGRTEPSAIDRFEYAVEELLEGPVAEANRSLLFVVDGLARVSTPHLEHWGYLMARLSGRGLKLLVWGGQELHDLRTRPASGGRFSSFHILRPMRVGLLSPIEVRAILAEVGRGADAAAIFDATSGHPALVRELAEAPATELHKASPEAIAARLLAGDHASRLRRALAEDPDALATLRELASSNRQPLLRGRFPAGEERLRWLGVLDEANPTQWDWTAPLMPRLAAATRSGSA